MKKLMFVLLCLCLCTISSFPQTQRGIVKTRGRMVSGKYIPGEGLPGTIISVRDKGKFLVHEKDGKFSFPITTGRFMVDSVNKSGYVLLDSDFLGRQFKYSDNPLYVVMETPSQLLEDKLIAERKIRRSLQNKLNIMEEELEVLKEQNKISAEEYRKALQKFYAQQETNEKLISEMADRYSRLDYDQLDNFYREVSDCILRGDLVKADSLLNTKGDLNSEIAEFKRLKKVNAQEMEAIAARQDNLDKSIRVEKYRLNDLAQRCFNKYEIYGLQFQNDSAAYYLETRADLDTTNIEWGLNAGHFLHSYYINYKKALMYYSRALTNALLKQELNEYDVDECYYSLAILYLDMGDLDDAELYFNKALQIRIKLFEDNHSYIAEIYNGLGSLNEFRGMYADAIMYYNKAIDTYDEDFGKNHKALAMSYSRISSLYRDIGDSDKCMFYSNKALEIMHNISGKDKWSMADIYNEIGNLYRIQNKDSIALIYLNKALETNKEILGDYHPDVAFGYSSIGVILTCQKKYSAAIEHLKKSLQILLEINGKAHPALSVLYNNIGFVYEQTGDYNTALEYFRKALENKIVLLGENHGDVAFSYMGIGTTLSYIGNYSSAAMYLEKSLEIWAKLFEDSNLEMADVHHRLAAIYSKLGEDSKMFYHLDKELEIMLKFLDASHPDVIKLYLSIAQLYMNMGNYQKSLEYFYKLLEIKQSELGSSHKDVANCYKIIGSLYNKLGDYNTSLSYHNKACDIFLRLYGEDDPNVVSMKNILLVTEYEKEINSDRNSFGTYMSDKLFTATVVSGTSASEQGMEGTYYLLEFADWMYKDSVSIYQKMEELKGKPKTLTVLQDGEISKYSFENIIGVEIKLKVVSKKERNMVDKLYREWK